MPAKRRYRRRLAFAATGNGKARAQNRARDPDISAASARDEYVGPRMACGWRKKSPAEAGLSRPPKRARPASGMRRRPKVQVTGAGRVGAGPLPPRGVRNGKARVIAARNMHRQALIVN